MSAQAETVRPKWITEGKLSDAANYYVVCSHDGLDPQETRQIAESKCLASAAKLGGATVTVKQKTVQSLTGSDSAETAEIEPLTKFVRCIWTDHFLESIQNGVRIWLRCQVDQASVQLQRSISTPPISTVDNNSITTYKRGVLNLISVPTADRILILKGSEERAVVEVKSNVERIELHEGDSAVVVRKQKFIDQKIQLEPWSNGGTLNKTVYLNRDL